MSENAEDLTNLTAERNRLQTEVARLRVSRDTGVPLELLSNGNTTEECEQIAADLLAWKAAAQSTQRPPATPAAPASGVGQMSRATLAQLPPGYQLEAWRTGRLESLGAPKPPPRQDGVH